MKKTFGNEPTKLTLTKLAQYAYNMIDPVRIIENQDTDGNVTGYDMIGCVQGKGMTDRTLERLLQEADEETVWKAFEAADFSAENSADIKTAE